ncbi:MAG: PspC domain-containing protein [Oscillospiraceae bacterium]|nr:PspC domain-containing protein [Oscillospiraceae bacterium]
MNKKLYKVAQGKVLCGVCGGVAEYLGIDPTLVRVGWAVLCCFAGAGILAYIVAAIVMPEKPGNIIDQAE